LFAINNGASNGTPLIKILSQDFNRSSLPRLDSINLQLLIADPEKDSVTVNLFVSNDNGINYKIFDSFKKYTQIDTVYRMVHLKEFEKVQKMVLKVAISDNVSGTADSTLFFYNTNGIPTDAERVKENTEISIYPNPFTDELSIQTNGNREYLVELLTITGRILYQSKMEGNFHRINLRDQSSGIYFVRMKSDNFVSNTKVIKR
jgi:hypothetical protein